MFKKADADALFLHPLFLTIDNKLILRNTFATHLLPQRRKL
jgi:hypothetical protein